MKRIDVYFLLLATLLLVCGAVLGIVMGARQDFTLVPVHAHLNLAGWASLALFGLTYRAYPALAERKLAAWHFAVSSVASLLLPVGIGLAVLNAQPGLAIVAAILWVVGVLMFLFQVLSLLGTAHSVAAPAE
jgi:hypothetical protein